MVAVDGSASPGQRASERLAAIDAARALAVLGMISVNVGPNGGTGLADVLHRLPLGRASLLFVVLAGLGVSLMTRRARRPGGRVPTSALLWRAGLLVAGGLALQRLDHGVSVILPTYAALFLLALPLARAPERLVGWSAVAAMVGGPVAWIALQRARGADYPMSSPVLGEPLGDVVHSVAVSGPYPVVTWAGPFLLGMWLGRQDLSRRRFHTWLIAAGALATVGGRAVSAALVALLGEPADTVGFDRLVTAVGHSQMPLWLVSGTGTALLLLGALLRAGDLVRRRLWPLVVTGQLALTLYVAHLGVLAVLVRPEPHFLYEGILISASMSVWAVILAVMWRQRFPRGPLESLLRPPWTYPAVREAFSGRRRVRPDAVAAVSHRADVNGARPA